MLMEVSEESDLKFIVRLFYALQDGGSGPECFRLRILSKTEKNTLLFA